MSDVEENTERKQAVPVCFFYGIICVSTFYFSLIPLHIDATGTSTSRIFIPANKNRAHQSI